MFLDYFISVAETVVAQHTDVSKCQPAIARLCNQIASYLHLYAHVPYYQHPNPEREDTAVVLFKNHARMADFFIKLLQHAHAKNRVEGEDDSLVVRTYGNFIVIENISSVFEVLELETPSLDLLEEAEQKHLMELEKEKAATDKTAIASNKASFFAGSQRRVGLEIHTDWQNLSETIIVQSIASDQDETDETMEQLLGLLVK